MRSTESIFSVAEGLNNSTATVSKYYSDGEPTKAEFSLAAALDIRQRTAKGQSLKHAQTDTEFLFKDPLRVSQLAEHQAQLTSVANGLRCSAPFGEKAKQLKQMLQQNGITTSQEKVACFKFLDCFACPFHAIIAEVQDVWLLMSFNDVLLESLIRPSVNSVPSSKLLNVSEAVQSILNQILKKYPDVYQAAKDKHLNSPHPLWADQHDLAMLIGVYQ